MARDQETGPQAEERMPVRRCGGKPQWQKVRVTGWTQEKRAGFLATLRETSNVTYAAQAVGMSVEGAYKLRQRDPGFASAWMAALEEGYAELEMLLLRQARFGTETVETVDDGKGGPVRTRTTRSTPHTMAVRLLIAHRAAVTRFRQDEHIVRPDSEAVRAEILAQLADTRERLHAARAWTERLRPDEGDGFGDSGRDGGDGGWPEEDA